MSEWLQLLQRSLPAFLQGSLVTLQLTVVGLSMGFVLGLLSALARVYGGKWVRGLAVGYIELFRGTPVLVQLFLIYFGLPGLGITLSRMTSAYLAMGLNSGAYQAEYLRGSILAIGDGQMMAGRAIGMSRFKTIWDIIPPRWKPKCNIGINILEGAGVEVLLYEGKVLNDGEFRIKFDGEDIEP